MIDNLSKEELIDLVNNLIQENKQLKEKLYGHKTEEINNIKENIYISNEDKVKLFMSIFCARTDVYAKRWTSNKTGKSGYSPVCKNEFNKYKCDKFNVKCSECVHRELEPLTEDVIMKHLKGEITIGIYPLLLGDMCNFLAIDFDKKTFFTNPKFYELQKLRMPVYNTPRIISCFEEDERFLILPRGCIDGMKEICIKSNVELKIKDTRETGTKTDFKFNGKLTSKQQKAMDELLKYETGVLCATTGFGKTVVASKIISELKTNTLILVNRTSLLEQWKERISFFLGINKKEIGQIGAGKNKQTNILDIGSLQTLYKQDNIDDIVKNYGLVIVDECHHISAFSFEQVLKKIRAKNVYGLTATPIRKDGQHPIIYMQCGKIRYRVSNKELKQNKEMEHSVIVRKTNYKYIPEEYKEKIQIAEILTNIAKCEYRNNIIIEDIKQVIEQGRIPIVLTERVEHLEILKNKIDELNLDVPIIIYKGNMGKKKLKDIREVIEEADKRNKPRVIIATSTSIGEGFDDSRLDTLFLTMPVSWKGRIIQYVGRLHREHVDKKKVIVYDYLDDMKVLDKMYNRRLKGYKVAGYEILDS